MADIDLILNADLAKATKDISKFSKNAESALNGLKSSFGALKALAVAAAGAFAVKEAIQAANVQEKAVKSLNTALALTGEYTEETSQRFQKFASELQKNSTVGDEVTLSLVGLTKSMGATNEQTEKIIQAAADMSAVTGDDLETSVRNLSKTLGGMKGLLGQTQPELRKLTAEQLKNGDAIDILAKKYKGAASELTNTFSGALTQTQNSFGDLLEEIGFLITKNPIMIDAVKLAGEAFNVLGSYISDNREAITNFIIEALASLLDGLGWLIRKTGDVVNVFTNFNTIIDLALLKTSEFGSGAVEIADNIIKSFKGVVSLGLEPMLDGIDIVASGLNKLGIISDDSLNKFKDAIEGLAPDETVSGLEKIKASIDNFGDAARTSFIDGVNAINETKNSFDDAGKSVEKFGDRLRSLKNAGASANKELKKLSTINKNITDKQKAAAASPGGSPAGGAFENLDDLTLIINVIKDLGKAVSKFSSTVASGFAAGIAGGAQGANSLFQTAVGAGADAFIPGSGAGASAIAGLLAAGPEAAKAQAEAFIDQIPIIMENVAEALPVLVETLAENSDKIILALVEGTPRIAAALAYEVPIALAKSLPGAVRDMLQAAIGGLQFKFDQFFTSVGVAFTDIGNKLRDAFTGAINFFKQFWDNTIGALFKGVISIDKQIFDAFVKGTAHLYYFLWEAFVKATDHLVYWLKYSFIRWTDHLVYFLRQTFIEGGSLLFKEIRDALSVKLSLGTGSSGGNWYDPGNLVTKFSHGGEVPDGFANDTFPAMLSSRENVIDRTTNDKLKAFLDSAGGGSSGPMMITLQIGEKQLAEVMLNLNRQGFRTA